MKQNGYKVLLVEDNEATAGDYVGWLRAAGHTVEHALASSDGVARAADFQPDVVLLDLQIPSEPNAADEDVRHGLRTLDALLDADRFRPVVTVSAHNDRELVRQVLQRTHGGQFVFKDDDHIRAALVEAVVVAVNQPAYKMSRTVREFRAMVDAGDKKEDAYRDFIRDHWRVILGPEYREVKAPYPIARGGDIDILAVRHDGLPDLWELKRPSEPVFVRYNTWLHHSSECAKAIGQLMEYFDAAEKSDPTYDRRHGVQVTLQRPRGFVVIGRYKDAAERERLRLENSFLAGITVLTYDDLIERAEQFLLFLQQYRNGHDLPR